MILNYISVLIPLAVLDAVWLMFLGKGFYAKHMSFLFSDKINLTPVLFFYPLYALGVLYLVVLPSLSSGNIYEALWRGALLGLVSYGAYDLTNHATIVGWPAIMTVVDMLWGATVTGLSAVSAFYLINLFK